MIRFFEEQERQRSLQVGNALRKSDLVLHERVCTDNRRENSLKIPYQNEFVRKELQNTLAKNDSKICKDNLRICDESLGRRLVRLKLVDGALVNRTYGDRCEQFTSVFCEIKSKANREEKMKQLLWETSPELRELRKLMLTADVTKDQAMQIAQKQALAELKKQEEESLAAAAEEEKRKYEEKLKRKEELEFQAKLKYHKDLDYLRQFRAAKEDKDEETLKKERDAIDDIKKQIEEEDREIARRKLESQKELYQQAVELQKVRENMKLLEKQKEISMDLKADEYRKAHELRTKHLEEEKRFNMEQKLQLQEELLFYLEKMYAEKAQQDHLWTELSIVEKEALEKAKTSAAEKRQTILKEELQQLYDMQMYVKKQKEELRKKEEELFRENLLCQLYEEEKLEQMCLQKRRLKQCEHRRIAQELIEQNRKKKEIEQAREKADIKLLKDREVERLRLVEEERRKFLSEHAKELLGFLPKKVFRDKDEIERLGEEFKKFYSRKNCSTLYQVGK